MFLDDDGAVVEILQDDFGGAAADLRHRNRDRGKSRRQVFQKTAVVPADYRQLLRHPHLTGGQHPQQLAGDPVVGADHQRKIPGTIPENPLHRFKGNLLGHKHFALFGDPGVLGGGLEAPDSFIQADAVEVKAQESDPAVSRHDARLRQAARAFEVIAFHEGDQLIFRLLQRDQRDAAADGLLEHPLIRGGRLHDDAIHLALHQVMENPAFLGRIAVRVAQDHVEGVAEGLLNRLDHPVPEVVVDVMDHQSDVVGAPEPEVPGLFVAFEPVLVRIFENPAARFFRHPPVSVQRQRNRRRRNPEIGCDVVDCHAVSPV